MTIALGAAIFLLGLFADIQMYVERSWPTYLFFVVMGLGMAIALFGLWARRASDPAHPPGLLRTNSAVVAALVLVGNCLAWLSLVDVRRAEAHEVTWRYGPPSEHIADAKNIILTFVDRPESIGIYSRDLGDYLESLRTKSVRVRIEVRSDFGHVRSFRIVQIGERTHWQSYSVYTLKGGDSSSGMGQR